MADTEKIVEIELKQPGGKMVTVPATHVKTHELFEKGLQPVKGNDYPKEVVEQWNTYKATQKELGTPVEGDQGETGEEPKQNTTTASDVQPTARELAQRGTPNDKRPPVETPNTKPAKPEDVDTSSDGTEVKDNRLAAALGGNTGGDESDTTNPAQRSVTLGDDLYEQKINKNNAPYFLKNSKPIKEAEFNEAVAKAEGAVDPGKNNDELGTDGDVAEGDQGSDADSSDDETTDETEKEDK